MGCILWDQLNNPQIREVVEAPKEKASLAMHQRSQPIVSHVDLKNSQGKLSISGDLPFFREEKA
jgi:hypothetical protein